MADVLNLLMYDNVSIQYQKLYLIKVFLILPLTFLGLVIVNEILSALQSHLTQPFMKLQIDSIEDIYNSSIPISTVNLQQATLCVLYLKNITGYNWNDNVWEHLTNQHHFSLILNEQELFQNTKNN